MALSTSMPTPRARPPNETVFSVKPLKNIREKVAMTEIGIARPMMRVLETLRKKKRRTSTARAAPCSIAVRTLAIEARMKSALSRVFSIRTCGRALWIRSTSSHRPSDTSTVFAPACL